MSKRWTILASCFLLLSFLLASCYLVSGERIEKLPLEGMQPGVYTVRFVSADGEDYRDIETGIPSAPFIVEVNAETKQGELIVAVLDSRQEDQLVVTARLDVRDSGQTTVRTDADGKIMLHITATEAHSGAFTIRYVLAAPLTPTPTAPPTPAP
jgi:5-hydroxyisourate hydrolase-like protein (transthyretin family)